MNGYTKEAFQEANTKTREEMLFGMILHLYESGTTKTQICKERTDECDGKFKKIDTRFWFISIAFLLCAVISVGSSDLKAILPWIAKIIP